MHEIHFYRASEKPYGALSNLYRRDIVFEGEVFATSEHAYQAGKARKPAVRKWLMEAPSPALLAMAAHGLYYWDIAPGWSTTKFDRMRAVLRAKFTQYPDLRELLLSTRDARLVESATVDSEVNRLWGEVNGVGRNMLGVLLMEIRDELRLAGADESKARLVAAE
ncbi:NADAR family protein [Mesorhizobium sp. M0074]|uniref:NADAR family protein n=1 Tax=Mesorhizobium sp. M0074 TaxID=2956869 RepID=UPI0033371D21